MAAPLGLFEPREASDLPLWVEHAYEGDFVVRKIFLRGKEVSTCCLPLVEENSGDAHADYDLAWLFSKTAQTASAGEPVRTVDLFSGCGGLSLGIGEAARAVGRPHQALAGIDLSRSQREIFKANFPEAEVLGDDVAELFAGDVGDPVTDETIEGIRDWLNLDVLAGGPPCQGHSNLNNYTRADDDRNNLALKMARAAEVLNPKFVIVENVPGVLKDKRGMWQAMKDSLHGLGYETVCRTMKAERYGVAQRRHRQFVLAWKENQFGSEVKGTVLRTLEYLEVTQPRHVTWVLNPMISRYDGDSVFNSQPNVTETTQARINELHAEGEYNLQDQMRPDCHREKSHTYKSVYGRMRPDRPASTMTTGFSVMGRGRFVHPTEPRMLTPHEAAMVQFFPDFFDFGDRGRNEYCEAIGNAVPSKLGMVVALGLLVLTPEQ